MGFDRFSLAIIIVVVLVLLAYNYGFIFTAPTAGVGLLNRINSSNVLLYVIIFIAGALLFVTTHKVNLSERIRITNASLLAILASFFIFASIFYFVAGFNDTFITPSTTPQLPRQMYGWLVEFLVYAAIAIILLQLGKKMKKTREREFAARVYPIGTILGVFIVIILFIGFSVSEAAEKKNFVMQIGSIENIFEVVIFGSLAYFFIWTEDSILRKQELSNENLYAPAVALGICCVIISVIAYAAAVLQYVEVGGYITGLFSNLAGAVAIGFVGVSIAIVASLLFRPSTGGHVVSPMLFLFGATYAIFAIVELFMGLDDYLRSPEPDLRWAVAVALLLVPSLIAYAIAPIIRRKSDEYYGKEKAPIRKV